MTDIVERLRDGAIHGLVSSSDAMEAADEIERLKEERDGWKQAAQVEAGLRREFLADAERLRAALAEIIELKPEDMPHSVENSMAAAIARHALAYGHTAND